MNTTQIDYKASQAARTSAAQAMHAAFPYLVPVAGKVDSLQAAAKNIRIQLARAFPGVKFSVKSRRFSMGDAIDVRWTDGPTGDQVDAIANRYRAGSFDGMTDCYNYSRDAWTDAFGDAKYIHTTRQNSDRAIASAMRTAASRYAIANGVELTIDAYRNGDYWNVRIWNETLQGLIGQIANRRTWALTKKEQA